jgi:hypothetical protein
MKDLKNQEALSAEQSLPSRTASAAHTLAVDGGVAFISSAAVNAMFTALMEVEWIFDGQEDITDTGAPNDAMRALTVVRAALLKASGGD